MKGSEFVSRFEGASAAEREARIFDLVKEGSFIQWPWKPVLCASGPFHGTFYVASDYFSLGEQGDFVRMPISPLLAQKIADLFGWSLPTKFIVDLVWNAADVVVSPITETPDAGMVKLSRFARNNARIQEALAATVVPRALPTSLVAGMKKDVVLSNKLVKGRVAIYGWHQTTGVPIQGLNATSHEDSYADYSHGVRFVRGDMLVNDSPMKLLDVFSSPELSKLVSDEGVLRVTRQPGTEAKVEDEKVLKLGDKGSGVADWQAFLNDHGFLDPDGKKLVADGAFGARTEFATKAFQAKILLPPTGIVDAGTLSKAAVYKGTSDTLPPSNVDSSKATKFVQAKNFTPANRTKIDVVVIHDMEYPERSTGAEWCADFFAGPNAPKASAHYAVDNDSIVQCVREKDVAWHAPGANNNGIGIEHAGYAAQTRDQWLDDYSKAELVQSSRLVADICRRWNIPIVKISAVDLKAGVRGICGHKDVTDAFSKGVGHFDPGPNFPWDVFLEMVKAAS